MAMITDTTTATTEKTDVLVAVPTLLTVSGDSVNVIEALRRDMDVVNKTGETREEDLQTLTPSFNAWTALFAKRWT